MIKMEKKLIAIYNIKHIYLSPTMIIFYLMQVLLILYVIYKIKYIIIYLQY